MTKDNIEPPKNKRNKSPEIKSSISESASKNIITPHFYGHRERLRRKAEIATNALHDYELIELILFSLIPRRDVKLLAKSLLKIFNHSVRGLFNQKNHITNCATQNQNDISNFMIKVIGSSYEKFFDGSLVYNHHYFSTTNAIINYLSYDFQTKYTKKCFVNINYSIFYMNKKQILVSKEDLSSLEMDMVIKKSVLEGVVYLIIAQYIGKNFNFMQKEIKIQKTIHKNSDILIEDDVNIRSNIKVNKKQKNNIKSNQILDNKSNLNVDSDANNNILMEVDKANYIIENYDIEKNLIYEKLHINNVEESVESCKNTAIYTIQQFQTNFSGFTLIENEEEIDEELFDITKQIESEAYTFRYKCLMANIKLLDYLVINNKKVLSLKYRNAI